MIKKDKFFRADKQDKDDRLILARAEDNLFSARKNFCVKTLGFLNPHQRAYLLNNLEIGTDTEVIYDGGYDDAERVLIVAVPEISFYDRDEFISVVKITGRDMETLNHRDYLGSLMGLGITRENIGDIITSDDGASVFVKPEIASYIDSNLEKIGRHGVKTVICPCSEADIAPPAFKDINGTVSSLRLDAVLSFALGISRKSASDLINSELVMVNFRQASSQTLNLEENDLISARGYGRFRVKSIGTLTRKGRISITVSKFL